MSISKMKNKSKKQLIANQNVIEQDMEIKTE